MDNPVLDGQPRARWTRGGTRATRVAVSSAAAPSKWPAMPRSSVGDLNGYLPVTPEPGTPMRSLTPFSLRPSACALSACGLCLDLFPIPDPFA